MCILNGNEVSISEMVRIPPSPNIAFADFGHARLLAPKTFKIIWFYSLSTLSVPDEGYSRNTSCFYFYGIICECQWSVKILTCQVVLVDTYRCNTWNTLTKS